MRLRRLLLAMIVGLLVCGSITSALSYYMYRRPLPQTKGAVGVEGLREAVSIYRDEWGVPHIYAATPDDLFFAQGYVHAQDRWWQMEVNRHLGRGQISMILGSNKTALTTDKLIRTVGWPRIAEEQWGNASLEGKRTLRAYAAGINRYIAERSQSDLAMQYTILGLTGGGFEVATWQPIDSLAWATVMNWHWDGNLSQEIERARIYGTLDEQLAASYFPEMVWNHSVIQPEDLPFDLQTYAAPPNPPDYPPGVDYRQVNTRLVEDIDLQDPSFIGLQAGPGSTAWAVQGANSASGQPLLANAPQTIISIPSQWYEIGLHCIEVTPACPYDVVGFSAPGLPLIVAGHNQNIAWGVTNTGIDTQDVYLVKLHDTSQYEYEGTWKDIQILTETIEINDDESLAWPVYMTDWGPIISEQDEDSPYALALHWPGLQGDWTQMLLDLNRATNWDEFRAALQLYGGTPLHFLYADTQNNIGYQLAGMVPVRAAGHSGQSPVPGWTTLYEWRGFVPFDYLPSVYNPVQGRIGVASQPSVPPEYSAWLQKELSGQFGADATYIFAPYWQPNTQAGRLEELLTTLTPHNTDTFAQMQADTENKFAARLVSHLLRLDVSDETKLQEYQNWLADWNFRHEMDNPQAVLVAVWWVRLNDVLFGDQLESEPSGSSVQRYALLNLLDDPDNLWWDNTDTPETTETRDIILRETFLWAIEEAEEEFGVLRDSWRWDELHRAHFVSLPVGSIGIVGIEEVVNRGPEGTGGSIDTLNATVWSTSKVNRYEVITLPSYRMIIDLGNFDNSRGVHTTGQSGHPASEHYADMIDLWRTVAYHDMMWDTNIIRGDDSAVLRLQPDFSSEES